MTNKVKKLKQSLYGSDWKPEDNVGINSLNENNKHINNKTHSISGYQPKKVPIPPTPTKGSSAVSPKTPRKDIKFELDLDKFIERTDDLFIGHLQNEIEWYKKRMEEYRKSFWKVCDIVAKSSDLTKIKELTKKELERY